MSKSTVSVGGESSPIAEWDDARPAVMHLVVRADGSVDVDVEGEFVFVLSAAVLDKLYRYSREARGE